MKKVNKLFYASVMVMTGAVLLGWTQTKGEPATIDIALANIEALTETEQEPNKILCNSSGRMSPRDRYTDCSTCKPVEGYKSNGQEGLCTP